MEEKEMVVYDELAQRKAQRAIRQIARSQGITEAEVRAEMEIAMLEGYNSTDPAVQAEWAKAPFGGHVPTIEEFVAWCVNRLAEEPCMMQ